MSDTKDKDTNIVSDVVDNNIDYEKLANIVASKINSNAVNTSSVVDDKAKYEAIEAKRKEENENIANIDRLTTGYIDISKNVENFIGKQDVKDIESNISTIPDRMQVMAKKLILHAYQDNSDVKLRLEELKNQDILDKSTALHELYNSAVKILADKYTYSTLSIKRGDAEDIKNRARLAKELHDSNTFDNAFKRVKELGIIN